MIRDARSFLFVPANRVDRVDKALRGEADAVIVDLEDAVAPGSKTKARAGLESWTSRRPYLLRINAVGTSFHDDDLACLGALRRLAGVVLPKAESAHGVMAVGRRLPPAVELSVLIESAVGLLNAADIAKAGAARLMFGSQDYLADIGADASREIFAYPRGCLVVASAAAGIARPVDGPTLAFDDVATARAQALDSRAHGFTGKLCIHPRQVQPVNDVFSPSDSDRAWAERVVKESHLVGGGAFAIDGVMIDAPVVERARRLLDRQW